MLTLASVDLFLNNTFTRNHNKDKSCDKHDLVAFDLLSWAHLNDFREKIMFGDEQLLSM